MELIPFFFSLVFGLFFTFLFLGSMIGGSMYLFSRIRDRLSYKDQEDLESRMLDELDVLRIQVDALSNRLRAMEGGDRPELELLEEPRGQDHSGPDLQDEPGASPVKGGSDGETTPAGDRTDGR